MGGILLWFCTVAIVTTAGTNTCSGTCYDGVCYIGKTVDTTASCGSTSTDQGTTATTQSTEEKTETATTTATEGKTETATASTSGTTISSTTAGTTTATTSGLPKILCLHGGGGTGNMMRSEASDLVQALSGTFEFYFPDGAEDVGDGTKLWVLDPPGGKSAATTDPNFASASVRLLDDYIAANGPFAGIMGYSQGSMFTTYYLSQAAANTFEFAVMFCGYLPGTHQGLLNSINSQSPFNNIPALVWMGAQDTTILNIMTTQQASVFTSPVVLTSNNQGHVVVPSSDPTFNDVVSFITSRGGGTSTATISVTCTILPLWLCASNLLGVCL